MISGTLKAVFWGAYLFAAVEGSAQEAEPDAASEREGGDEPRSAAETCFDVERARDINVLSDQHVYVRTLAGNHYLLTMARRCDRLERSYRSNGVRIQPYGRRVCPNDGSHLLYTWFDRESVCPILTISAVEDRTEASAIAEGDRAPVGTEEIELPE